MKTSPQAPANRLLFNGIGRRLFAILVLAGSWTMYAGTSPASDARISPASDAGVSPVRAEDEPKLAELQTQYHDSMELLRGSIKACQRAKVEFAHAEYAESHDFRQAWEKAAEDSENAYSQFKKAGVELFLATPEPDMELAHVVRLMINDLYQDGALTVCYDVAKKLTELVPDDTELNTMLARAAIMTNHFSQAKELTRGMRKEIEGFSDVERVLFNYVDPLIEKYDRELKLREKDTNLPRVELNTTKGKIVIELFENEAPETVANFVSLVDAGFYDGIIFHRVFKNRFANAGVMTMNLAQSVGYTIYDEEKRPDARDHFRGSVCMVKRGKEENSASCQFYILNVPHPILDGNNTVFGRVISDMRVVDSLQETIRSNEEGEDEIVEDIIPDTIETAKAFNLRDHDYLPNRVKE